MARLNPLPIQCAESRCPHRALVGGRCPAHTRRGGGWSSPRPMGSGWARIRAAHLAQEPDCRVCGRPATTVDHILPRAFGGTDDPANLQSLCRVHAAKKDAKDAALGRKRANDRRRAR